MPFTPVEFFVEFLIDEGETVLDPFAGSNTTGAVAQSLDRRWLSVEADWTYTAHSIGRFDPDRNTATCDELAVTEIDEPECDGDDQATAASSSASAMPLFTSFAAMTARRALLAPHLFSGLLG